MTTWILKVWYQRKISRRLCGIFVEKEWETRWKLFPTFSDQLWTYCHWYYKNLVEQMEQILCERERVNFLMDCQLKLFESWSTKGETLPFPENLLLYDEEARESSSCLSGRCLVTRSDYKVACNHAVRWLSFIVQDDVILYFDYANAKLRFSSSICPTIFYFKISKKRKREICARIVWNFINIVTRLDMYLQSIKNCIILTYKWTYKLILHNHLKHTNK